MEGHCRSCCAFRVASSMSKLPANRSWERPLRRCAGRRNGNKRAPQRGIIPFEEAEKEFERDIILKALNKTNFVQTRAAELLGISRRILKYKMDKLGIGDKPAASSDSGDPAV